MKKTLIFIIGFMLISTMLAGCLQDSGSDSKNKEEYTSPVISIISPRNRATVTGQTEIRVLVSPVRPGQVITYSVDENVLESSDSLSYLWDTTTVENGEHLIEVTVQDTGQNVPAGTPPSKASATVNVYNPPAPEPETNTPPTVEINTPSGAVNGVYRGPILLTGRATDPETGLDSIEMRLDSGAWFDVQVRNGDWRKVLLPGANSGEVKVEVRAFDGTDYSEIKSIILSYDNLPPEISFISPENGGTLSDTVNIVLDVSDDHNLSFVSFAVDGEEVQNSSAQSFELDTTSLPNGEHTLKAGAADILGNYASEEIEVTVHNNNPPTAVISSPSDGAEFNEGDSVHFDASDSSDPDGDDLTYLWESDIDSTLSHEETFDSALSVGNHTITLTVSDPDGAEASNSVNVTVVKQPENQPPTVKITSPGDGEEVQGTITVKGMASDPENALSSVAYRVDNGEWQDINPDTNWSFELNIGDYGKGTHTIEVRAEDSAGNTAADSIDVVIKNNAPEIEINSPENGSAHRGILGVSGRVSDTDGSISSLAYRADDGDWNDIDVETDWSFNVDTTALSDGNHTITVRAVDNDNASSDASLKIFTDNTPPRVSDIIIDPYSIFCRQTITVEAEMSDLSNITYINFDFNDKSIQNSTGTEVSIDTTQYADGEYYLVINASDSLGNVLAEFSGNNSIPIVVDNTPPEVEITSPGDGDYVHGTAEIHARASDRNGIKYTAFIIDGNELQNSSSGKFQWDTTQFSEGQHNIKVLSSDTAGNTNSTSITVIVDNTPPDVSIDSPKEGETVDGTFYINVTASDPGAYASRMKNVMFYLGLTYLGPDTDAPYQMAVDTSNLSDGDYTVRVIGWDNAGNSKQSEVNITVRDTSGAIISDPHTNYLSPYPVAGVRHFIIHDYKGIPYLSPLVKQNVTPSVDWNSNDPAHELNISYTSVGRFSGNLALSYYSQPEPDYAVVVDNYRHALLMAPIAWMLDAPLILYDSRYTDEALWKMETIYAAQIIVMGNTPYNDKGVTVVQENGLLDFALSTANLKGISLHYIALTNPDDTNGNADVPHLSAFAAAFAIHHDGIVLPVPANANQINTIAHNAFTAFNNSGMENYFLALIGDARSVPFHGGSVGGNSAPSDNMYADLDGDLSTVEVPTGRIISKTLPDLSYYIDRIVHYADYLATENRDIVPTTPSMGPFWNNNALIYMGWATEELAWQTSYRHWQVFVSTLFSTQDDTPQAHGGGGTTLLMEDFARANFIAMNADHGEPSSTMTFSSSNLLDMHPGVLFAVSCSLGRIDGVNIQSSMTYTVLEKGMNVYLASTRTTYGAVGVTAEAADGLSLYFWQNLVTDETTGEAMMHAKQDLMDYGSASVNGYVCWEYVHYGDPAFNPYEPANEGS